MRSTFRNLCLLFRRVPHSGTLLLLRCVNLIPIRCSWKTTTFWRALTSSAVGSHRVPAVAVLQQWWCLGEAACLLPPLPAVVWRCLTSLGCGRSCPFAAAGTECSGHVRTRSMKLCVLPRESYRAFCFSDRLKYESKKSKSTSAAVSNDFCFSSIIPGNFKVHKSVSCHQGNAPKCHAMLCCAL